MGMVRAVGLVWHESFPQKSPLGDKESLEKTSCRESKEGLCYQLITVQREEMHVKEKRAVPWICTNPSPNLFDVFLPETRGRVSCKRGMVKL